MDRLLESEHLSNDDPFELFAESSEEGKFLAKRRDEMRAGQEKIQVLSIGFRITRVEQFTGGNWQETAGAIPLALRESVLGP